MDLPSLLAAAAAGDDRKISQLLDSGLHPGEQDQETGLSPLMQAAAHKNLSTVKILLEKGAPWNALDKSGKCAGNHAISPIDSNFDETSQKIVDHLVGHAVSCELILARFGKDRATCPRTPGHQDQSNEKYISSKLRYTEQSLIDGDQDGVMMAWETPIMNKHVEKLLESFELQSENQKKIKVLNVGFGMGIVDGFFQQGLDQVCQAYTEAGHPLTFEHHVIEAHPDVLKRLKTDERFSKDFKNFTVHEGRWQDVLAKMSDDSEFDFDFVYFDTYAEYDDDFYKFLQFLPKILKKPSGKFSFFNGNCPDNVFFHGVACEIIRLQLAELNLQVEFESVAIDAENDPSWDEVKRKYWFRKEYFLPHVHY